MNSIAPIEPIFRLKASNLSYEFVQNHFLAVVGILANNSAE
jgi:hypothetical protein